MGLQAKPCMCAECMRECVRVFHDSKWPKSEWLVYARVYMSQTYARTHRQRTAGSPAHKLGNYPSRRACPKRDGLARRRQHLPLRGPYPSFRRGAHGSSRGSQAGAKAQQSCQWMLDGGVCDSTPIQGTHPSHNPYPTRFRALILRHRAARTERCKSYCRTTSASRRISVVES